MQYDENGFPREPDEKATHWDHEDWDQYLSDIEARRVMDESDPLPWWMR